MGVGHGGQVLLSAAAAALCQERLPKGVTLRDLGEYRLRDLGRPERVYQLVHPDLDAAFPPLTTFDNIASLPVASAAFVGRLAPQPLSTIRTPRGVVGEIGAKLLLSRAPSQVIDLGFELFEGKTT